MYEYAAENSVFITDLIAQTEFCLQIIHPIRFCCLVWDKLRTTRAKSLVVDTNFVYFAHCYGILAVMGNMLT